MRRGPPERFEPIELEFEDAPPADEPVVTPTPVDRRWTWPVVIGAAVVIVGVSVATTKDHRAVPPTPTTTSTSVPGALTFSGRLAVQHEDKLSLPGGVVTITPLGTERDLIAVGHWVIALGQRDRAGAWAIDADHPTDIRYLGAADHQFPSRRPDRVWLIAGDQLREVGVDDVADRGPYSFTDPVVGEVGTGLVVQQGTDIIWWFPDAGERRWIGSGRVVDTGHESLLLTRPLDQLMVIDLNTGFGRPTQSVPHGEARAHAWMSADGGAVIETTERYTYRFISSREGSPIALPLGFAHGVEWIDTRVALLWWTHGALLLVDTITGQTRALSGLGYTVSAVAVVGS